ERKFAWQCRRHIRADVVPSFSISGTEIGEHSVYRVAVRDTTFGGPEGETIVERVGCLVLELHGPGRTTIDRFVDAKVGGVVSNGLQVSDLVAHALDVAELQCLSARHYPRFPGFSAVGGQDERAAGPGGPDHPRVHRTDRNQQLRRAAVLWRECGL